MTCAGFQANEQVDLTWDAAASPMTTLTADSAGALTGVKIGVPQGPGGSHHLVARGRTSGLPGQVDFSITPTIKLDLAHGPVGSTLTVSLTGFRASEKVTLDPSTSSTKQSIGSVTVSRPAPAHVQVTVPDADKKAHTIQAVGSRGDTAKTTFTIDPSISLSKTSGPPGARITIQLRGFAARELVDVRWYKSSKSSILVADDLKVSPTGSAGEVRSPLVERHLGQSSRLGHGSQGIDRERQVQSGPDQQRGAPDGNPNTQRHSDRDPRRGRCANPAADSGGSGHTPTATVTATADRDRHPGADRNGDRASTDRGGRGPNLTPRSNPP